MTILGGEEREIQVKANRDKLKLYKISLYQVVEAINRSGIDLPAGKVQTDKENNSVRLTGKFATIDDIKNVQVAMPMLGSPVYVKDVAQVVDGIKETTSISRYNGKDGVGILLKKQGDANAVDVSKMVRAKFKSIEAQIPLQRLAAPAEIAAAVMYLVSEHGAYVTGETLSINGGLYMH